MPMALVINVAVVCGTYCHLGYLVQVEDGVGDDGHDQI
jgi:hypothetical protein